MMRTAPHAAYAEDVRCKYPTDRPVTVLCRHAERETLPAAGVGNDVPLTTQGRLDAHRLGASWQGRLGMLCTSPVRRCVQTAEALRCGAGADLPIHQDTVLGNPGVFVEDDKLAWRNWEGQGSVGNDGVIRALMRADPLLPGMAHPDRASKVLIRHMLTKARGISGLQVCVTHDVLLAATVARFMGVELPRDKWPAYLDAAWIWQEGVEIVMVFRGLKGRRPAAWLVAD